MDGDTSSTAPSELRAIRARLNLSQADCAVALGVALETFRPWDSGRRPPPAAVVRRAEALAAKRPAHQRLLLQLLADELHLHVRTWRTAARDGRPVQAITCLSRHHKPPGIMRICSIFCEFPHPDPWGISETLAEVEIDERRPG
jgi:transcriptional regulator with XRE-family HTH domain